MSSAADDVAELGAAIGRRDFHRLRPEGERGFRASFTPEERALLDAGFTEILAKREAREWVRAIRDAAPQLVQAALEAAEKEMANAQRPAEADHDSR
ncbi:hypothetical protein ACGFYU_18060 [Streptomyces sp. NPDC048337]|uniref:hypothetical protein n=1 Tax=Streptomyces sp. NPDC048337 TaxID=3365535 RepID=UPI003724BF9B